MKNVLKLSILPIERVFIIEFYVGLKVKIAERDFAMIFNFMAAQNFVAEHHERGFDMIFNFMTAQNLVAEHSEREFDMIFNFMAAQNFVAEHSERDFDIVFLYLKFVFFGGFSRVD